MAMLRRATAVLLNLVLLQVSLAGYGAACAAPSDAMSPAPSATMAMDHAPAPDASHETERACVGPLGDDGCSLPWAPMGCAALTTCVAMGMPARTNLAFADAPAADRGWGNPALARPAPRPAPDLPPPRA